MNSTQLKRPSAEWKYAYIDYYEEWKAGGEEWVPWVAERDPQDFEGMLEWLDRQTRGEGIPEGWVPASTFWLVSEEGRVIGVVNIRHALTPYLRERGGHIGYGIRPSERRKGHATRLLHLALAEAKELGIRDVLVVCDADNSASERTIARNGGVSEDDFVEESGNVVKRYWIAT